MNPKTKKLTLYSMLLAVSMVLSYIEAILPFNIGIPGVKVGFPNIVTVIALYALGPLPTILISMMRILLVAMTFGNAQTLAYSVMGFLLSFSGMLLLRHLRLTKTAVSICGGVLHNVGQLLTAMALLQSPQLAAYFPVLLVAGIVAGMLIGLVSGILAERLKPFFRGM